MRTGSWGGKEVRASKNLGLAMGGMGDQNGVALQLCGVVMPESIFISVALKKNLGPGVNNSDSKIR